MGVALSATSCHPLMSASVKSIGTGASGVLPQPPGHGWAAQTPFALSFEKTQKSNTCWEKCFGNPGELRDHTCKTRGHTCYIDVRNLSALPKEENPPSAPREHLNILSTTSSRNLAIRVGTTSNGTRRSRPDGKELDGHTPPGSLKSALRV